MNQGKKILQHVGSKQLLQIKLSGSVKSNDCSIELSHPATLCSKKYLSLQSNPSVGVCLTQSIHSGNAVAWKDPGSYPKPFPSSFTKVLQTSVPLIIFSISKS